MPRHSAQRHTQLNLRFGIANQLLNHRFALNHRALWLAKNALIGLRQGIRLMVKPAPDHHAINVVQLFLNRCKVLHAAIQADVQIRKILLEPMNDVVAQRRNFAVFFRT